MSLCSLGPDRSLSTAWVNLILCEYVIMSQQVQINETVFPVNLGNGFYLNQEITYYPPNGQTGIKSPETDQVGSQFTGSFEGIFLPIGSLGLGEQTPRRSLHRQQTAAGHQAGEWRASIRPRRCLEPGLSLYSPAAALRPLASPRSHRKSLLPGLVTQSRSPLQPRVCGGV